MTAAQVEGSRGGSAEEASVAAGLLWAHASWPAAAIGWRGREVRCAGAAGGELRGRQRVEYR